jgi:hypothetical protein
MSVLLAASLGALLGAAVTALVLLRRRPVPSPRPDEHTARLADAGRRLAEVAHELNNPLAAIQAFAQDLLHGDPSPDQRQALELIQRQARRSRRLVRGLLDAVRSGPASRGGVDPHVVLDRVRPVFEHECAERGLTLGWMVPANLPTVEGEEQGLEQLLTNLLQNACQATPPGGEVVLAARARGRLLDLVVQDSGPGMPPQLIGRVFDPFFTTKPVGEGTGLGLSVAQDIARRHRGTLTAENVPAWEGTGARFVVSLPFEDRRQEDRDPFEDTSEFPVATPPSPTPAAAHRGPAGENRLVLLVEDEEAIRLALRRFLERDGWRVEETSDGSVAGRLLESGHYDAVLCDVGVPGVPGTTLYRRLRERKAPLARRMVLVTGDRDTVEVTALRVQYGVEVMQKPFDLVTLATALDRAARER